MGKVQIVPDELGSVVRQSKNNPEYGFVRLTQDKVSYTSTGWLKRSTRSTLLAGKMEDFDAVDMKNQTELPGQIIVVEQTEPFNANDPDRDLKIAGETGIICCVDGEPIYRKTFFDPTGQKHDTLLDHTNGDAIREANNVEESASKSANPGQVDIEDAIKMAEADQDEEATEEVTEEVTEEEEVDEVNADFEL